MSTSEATKEVTLEEVTYGAAGWGGVGVQLFKKERRGRQRNNVAVPRAGDGKAG